MENPRTVLIFIAKSVAFSFIWWTVFLLVARPILFGSNSYSKQLEKEAIEQSEAYSKRLDEAAKQSLEAENQQKRMNKLLERYEQQADRYDSILKKWERQPQKS